MAISPIFESEQFFSIFDMVGIYFGDLIRHSINPDRYVSMQSPYLILVLSPGNYLKNKISFSVSNLLLNKLMLIPFCDFWFCSGCFFP